jgi:hypothetical protein
VSQLHNNNRHTNDKTYTITTKRDAIIPVSQITKATIRTVTIIIIKQVRTVTKIIITQIRTVTITTYTVITWGLEVSFNGWAFD